MQFLLALTFLLTPAYVIKFNLFGFPTDILMVWVILFWAIFFIWLIAKKQLPDFLRSITSLDKKIFLLTGLFFLSGIISLFVRGLDRAKLGQFIVLFLQPVSIFFIGRYLLKQFPDTKYYILNTIYFLLAAAGIYAVIQYFTLLGLPPAWWGNSNEPKRALSFFIHPNFYALFAAPLLAFLVPHLSGVILNPSAPAHSASSGRPERSRTAEGEGSLNLSKFDKGFLAQMHSLGMTAKNKFFYLACWLLGAIGLFLSLSRAGWLGLAAAIAVYLIVAADKKIRKTASVIVIFIVIVILAVPNFRYRVLLPFYGEKSAVSRFSLWDTGIKGVKESPLTGLGLTGFSRQWQTLNTDPGLTDTHNFPHNIFLDFWVETGLLGLISITILIGLYIYRGLKNTTPSASQTPLLYKEGNTATAVSPPNLGGVPREAGGGDIDRQQLAKLSIALFLIALIAQGLIDNPYFKNDLAMVFWVVLSLFPSPIHGEGTSRSEAEEVKN